jgi:hypothetical protein
MQACAYHAGLNVTLAGSLQGGEEGVQSHQHNFTATQKNQQVMVNGDSRSCREENEDGTGPWQSGLEGVEEGGSSGEEKKEGRGKKARGLEVQHSGPGFSGERGVALGSRVEQGEGERGLLKLMNTAGVQLWEGSRPEKLWAYLKLGIPGKPYCDWNIKRSQGN